MGPHAAPVMGVVGRLRVKLRDCSRATPAFVMVAACSSEGGSFEVPETEMNKVNEEAREGHTLVQYLARQLEFRDRASRG